jgi:polypeptide N-acetylgalactosaminyltransferase
VLLLVIININGFDSKLSEDELRENYRLLTVLKESNELMSHIILKKESEKYELIKNRNKLREEQEREYEEAEKNRNGAPGEMGKPVEIDVEKLSPEEKNKYEEGWERNNFNEYASDLISLHRSLPDFRDNECIAHMKWSQPLPSVSVIIIFHNEAFSTLLRTVHSVLDRSDPKLLIEIILVDDASTFGNTTFILFVVLVSTNCIFTKPYFQEPLKGKLESYVLKLEKVKLLRHKQREGLIRARLTGVTLAVGEVLIFLDSHCEATIGWLEPLIDPIKRNPNVSTVPVIQTIEFDTFEVKPYPLEEILVGGFDWGLNFNWHKTPMSELNRRKRRTDLIRSPTMAGYYSINNLYFMFYAYVFNRTFCV